MHLKKHSPKFDAVLAFKPTGWEHKAASLSAIRPSKMGSVTIYGMSFVLHKCSCVFRDPFVTESMNFSF